MSGATAKSAKLACLPQACEALDPAGRGPEPQRDGLYLAGSIVTDAGRFLRPCSETKDEEDSSVPG